LDKVLTTFDATMLSFEKWGKYQLAYPVNKKDYGIYFLLRFEVTDMAKPLAALFDELKVLFSIKINTLIMRHMITRLKSGQSLAYQRPPSLEEAPPKEMSGFSREGRGAHFGSRDQMRGGAEAREMHVVREEEGIV
ncbi:MAG: 30S ribosomal protein S6, partial [Candidatus Babeliales bacterium]